eukprot:1979876-Amphidinium_carterae.1
MAKAVSTAAKKLAKTKARKSSQVSAGSACGKTGTGHKSSDCWHKEKSKGKDGKGGKKGKRRAKEKQRAAWKKAKNSSNRRRGSLRTFLLSFHFNFECTPTE